MPFNEAVSQLLGHIQAVVQATLSFSGALWLGITLTAYAFAIWLNRRVNGNPLVHPLVVTTVIVIGLLSLTSTQVKVFQYEAGLLHWLLGPATVALALPMYAQWSKVRALGWRLVVAIFAAGVVAPGAGLVVFVLHGCFSGRQNDHAGQIHHHPAGYGSITPDRRYCAAGRRVCNQYRDCWGYCRAGGISSAQHPSPPGPGGSAGRRGPCGGNSPGAETRRGRGCYGQPGSVFKWHYDRHYPAVATGVITPNASYVLWTFGR